MKRFLYCLLHTPLRLFARCLYYLPIDSYKNNIGKKPYGVPPQGKIFTGYGDDVRQVEKFLYYFQELGGLLPNHAVLDVGCRTGKMAMLLTRFLNVKGFYCGLGIIKSEIDWCNQNISAKHPNFHFQYTGLYNQLYNTSDKTDTSNFVFPYENAKFDFVFLTSVFTHMMPVEVEHNINEIARVMKPGATCLMSFFIVNCVSEDLMIKKPTQIQFPYNKGFYRLSTLQAKDKYIAYDEEWLLEKLGNAGLKMESIQFGQWCGREHFVDYQDLIICSKV